VLPNDLEKLKSYGDDFDKNNNTIHLSRPVKKQTPLWIVKPSNSNGGHGIEVVEKIEEIEVIKDRMIVQKYIQNPFLINGHKFLMRLYVLITSFDPLTIYLYGDGLVRFATQPYSNSSEDIKNRFIHLTNFEVNKHAGNFIYNNDPSERCGHKWRLRSLWKYLKQWGLPVEDFGRIWSRIRDLVIKSVVSGLTELREDFKKSHESRYNCYKLLGYDVMLDSTFCPHLLEVNSRPSVYQELLDEAVNQPMVEEMFRIIGYHLPPNVTSKSEKELNVLSSLLGVKSFQNLLKMTFCEGLYNKILTNEDMEKHIYFNKVADRDEWIQSITSSLSPNDVKILIKSEEELNACSGFDRIFPSCESHKYFCYFSDVTYYDKLLDAVEVVCAQNHHVRDEVHREIRYYCIKHFPDGFGQEKVSTLNYDLGTKKEYRKSFNSMLEIQKRLNEMGGFATLRKSKTIDETVPSRDERVCYPKPVIGQLFLPQKFLSLI